MRRQALSALERSSSMVTASMQARWLSTATASTSVASTVPQLAAAGSRALPHQPYRCRSTFQPAWAAAAAHQQQPGAAQHRQSRSMFIQTSTTPNPASLMFIPGEKVMESGSASFDNAREGLKSPLAKRLFQIDGVTGVFFGSDFVTVTKGEDLPWNALKPEIFAAIMEHFTSGDPLFTDASAMSGSDTAIHEDDSEVVAMIKELLETRIRPAVMEDGGDIVFKGFDEETGQVVLKMQGACSGCPSSSLTLKSGIENMLMHYIPEVKEVIEAPADEAELAGLEEFNKLEQHLSA